MSDKLAEGGGLVTPLTSTTEHILNQKYLGKHKKVHWNQCMMYSFSFIIIKQINYIPRLLFCPT